jgi:Helix-turn-helix domain of resolvase
LAGSAGRIQRTGRPLYGSRERDLLDSAAHNLIRFIEIAFISSRTPSNITGRETAPCGWIDEYLRRICNRGCRSGPLPLLGRVSRKPKLTAHQVEMARGLLESGKPPRDVAKAFGVGRSTLYRVLKLMDDSVMVASGAE